MRRRLLNLATLLSLSLMAAAAAMWVRSQIVPEAWGLTPHPIPKPRFNFNPESWEWERKFNPEFYGWERWRMLGSERGRFVWVSVDEGLYLGRPGRSGGYHQGQFMPPDWEVVSVMRGAPTSRTHGEVPGVAEWALLNVSDGGRFVQVVTVSWFVPAFVGAVLPAVRLWLYRRRIRVPTFPVLPAK